MTSGLATVLVVNTGSTSVKLSLFQGQREGGGAQAASGVVDEPLVSIDVPVGGMGRDRIAGIEEAIRGACAGVGHVAVVGHRIVHGADRFSGPVVVDAGVEEMIGDIAALAPLHNRAGLDGIAAARRVFGGTVVQVAVFDTTFHATMPKAATTYGGPYEWIGEGLRRYGFHGISHEWAAGRAASMLGRPLTDLRIVSCHLGGGCSLAAVDRGRSTDTTMGFTPLDGLVMGTRSGSVDPGLVLHLLRREGATPATVEETLEKKSGLLGLSGVSQDLRDVVAARDSGDDRAGLAVDVFVHRVVGGVGSMVAAMGGADALVFTGGIGEHSSEIRGRVCRPFAYMGVELDDRANGTCSADQDISSPGTAPRVLVIASRENLSIARTAWRFAPGRHGS